MERRIDRLSKLLLDNGYLVGKFITEKKDDAMEETIRSAKEDWDIIVACGGDGTVNEVAKGIMKSTRKVPVAILSSGTVNDFANFMEIPRGIKAFFNMIERGQTLDIDIGKANEEYFVNVAAGGLLTNVGYQVNIESKLMLGRMAYYLEGLRELTTQIIEPIKVDIESEEYTKKDNNILLFIISNSASIGGFKNLAPSADVSDGLLDVLIIENPDLQNLADIFFNIFSGAHVNNPYVKYFKTNNIKISSKEEVNIDIDGEYGGKLPVAFEIIPKAFRILI